MGPVWHGGQANEAELLTSCYRSCIQLANEHQLKSIAFPSNSCGVYGYPIEQACNIVINTTLTDASNTSLEIIFACINDNTQQALENSLKAFNHKLKASNTE